MKRSLCLLSVIMLLAVGCSKTETKATGSAVMKSSSSAATKPTGGAEKTLIGKWNDPAAKGFVAEFKNDHTGTTVTSNPADPKQTAVIPFKWSIESDGKVKIIEGKKPIFAKIIDKKLEIDFDGAKTVLEKAK